MFRKFGFYSVLFLLTAVVLICGCSQEKEPLVQEPEPIDEESEGSIEEQEPKTEEIIIPRGATELTTDAPQDVVVHTAYATDDRIFISFTCKKAGKLHLNWFLNSSDGEPVLFFSHIFYSTTPNEEYIVEDNETLIHRPKEPDEAWSTIVFSWED